MSWGILQQEMLKYIKKTLKFKGPRKGILKLTKYQGYLTRKRSQEFTSRLFDFIISEIFAAGRSAYRPGLT